jgi:3-dehydroquinate synthase
MTRHDSGGARVRVGGITTAATGYDVLIRQGAFDQLADCVTAAAPAAACAVITPRNLAASYGARALEALRGAGLRAELLDFDDREACKTRETWATLTDRMLELKLGRDTCVIAVGGGVTGDLAGFVAATYMRGIPFVQVPTTLLAMIDASVGGKTGVDTDAGKNLVGAFHAPAVVIIDPAALQTLPALELRSGIAEAVKHGAILDAVYFRWIDHHADDLLALDMTALEHLIARSVELKADTVSGDPFEKGRRAILNFGHTVGHALEHSSSFTMPHGFAVSIGMCIEASLGEAAGVTRAGTAAAIMNLLARFELPTQVPFEPNALLHAITIDKKARAAQPRFVLLRHTGECTPDEKGMWTHEVDPQLLRSTLEHAAQRGATASDLV